MHHTFSWKRGILGGIVAVVLGVGVFVWSSTMTTSTSCVAGVANCNDTPTSPFQGYADMWLRMFAKECVGGNGPDSCIGPNVGIMGLTLLVIGFVIGGFSVLLRKKNLPPQS